MTRRMGTVVLRDEQTGRDVRHLEAYLDEAGALHLDGQDLGPGTAPVSSDGEYEWFRTYAASDLPRVVAVLGGAAGEPVLTVLARFTGPASHELERLLRESDIPSEFHSWSG